MPNAPPPTAKIPPRRVAPSAEPYVHISALARKCATRPRFFSEVLRCVTRTFASPYAAIHVRFSSEVMQDDWHQGTSDPRFWKPGLQQFLTESLAESRSKAKLLLAKTDGTKIAFLSSPVFDPSGPSIGAIALVAVHVREADLAPKLAWLESLCRFASFAAEFVGRTAASPAHGAVYDRVLVRAGACSTAEEFAFAVTNDLRNRFGFEQVALAVARRNRVRLLSISGLDQVPKRSPGTEALRGAMEECLDAGIPIRYPLDDHADEKSDRAEYLLHKQWNAAAKGDAVASIPLRSGDTIVAVLSLRRRAGEPFTEEVLQEIRTKVEPAAPALRLLQRAGRGMIRHLRETAHEHLTSLLARGHMGRKIATLAALAAGTWFAFGSASYSISVPASVVPAQVRHLTAPFDGLLEEVLVAPADRVQAGQALCRLDDRELAQQEAALRAEASVWEHRRNQALSLDSPVEAQLAEANAALVRARLETVVTRRERAIIRAPFAGIVVSGDLRTYLGGTVSHGQALMSIAPLDRWTVELQVPERDIAQVSGTPTAEFRTFARPEAAYPFQIARVWPAAATHDHKNVFAAEGTLQGDTTGLRPGMEGVARVDVGRRPVRWVVLHGVLNWLRMRAWL